MQVVAPRRFTASTAGSVCTSLALWSVASLVNASEQPKVEAPNGADSPAPAPARDAMGKAASASTETATSAAPAPAAATAHPGTPSSGGPNTQPTVAAPELALGVTPGPTSPVPRGPESGTPFSVESEGEFDEQADDDAEKDGNQIAVYGQLFGSAVMIGPGVSYRAMDAFAVDFGIGYFNLCLFSCVDGITPSLQLSWLSGGDHNLEAGIGLAVTFTTGREATPLIGPHLGYRYQPTDGGFFFRALLHGPYIIEEDTLIPWPGFAFGANIDY